MVVTNRRYTEFWVPRRSARQLRILTCLRGFISRNQITHQQRYRYVNQPSRAHVQGKKVSRSLTRAFDAAHGRTMCGPVAFKDLDSSRGHASVRQSANSLTTSKAIARAQCLHDICVLAVPHHSCGSSNRLQYLKAQEHKVRHA